MELHDIFIGVALLVRSTVKSSFNNVGATSYKMMIILLSRNASQSDGKSQIFHCFRLHLKSRFHCTALLYYWQLRRSNRIIFRRVAFSPPPPLPPPPLPPPPPPYPPPPPSPLAPRTKLILRATSFPRPEQTSIIVSTHCIQIPASFFSSSIHPSALNHH